MAKSTAWYILKKKEHTGEVNNIKKHRRRTKVDDFSILSWVKNKPFTILKSKIILRCLAYHCQSLQPSDVSVNINTDSVTEVKTEGRKSPKHAAEGFHSEGLAKHLWGGNSTSGDVHGLQTYMN